MGVARQELIKQCKDKNLRLVLHRGTPGAPICVAGEAPGPDENRLLLPFVGASGWEQDKMMAEAGISPQEVWFTNAYKVMPPNSPDKNYDLSLLETLGVSKSVFEADFLEELNEHKPTIIICAGASSLSILCPDCINYKGDVVITNWQGSILCSSFLQFPHYIIPVLHPAFILRQWSDRQVSVFIYGRAREEYEYWRSHAMLQPLPIRNLIHSPCYSEAIDYIYEMIHYPESPRKLTCDIETNPNKSKALRWRFVYLIGIGKSKDSAISIPIWNFQPHQTAKILFALQELFDCHDMVNQNLMSFDGPWLLKQLGLDVSVRNTMQDTMTKHKILWPELPHSLQFLTMMYTREPYYKEEGKGVADFSPASMQRFGLYNAKDCTVTYEVDDAMDKELLERS